MLESTIERKGCELAESHGWYYKKVITPGRRGSFDRVFIKDGRTVWIELKRPERLKEKRKGISPLQRVEYEQLVSHGAEAYFAYSVKEVMDFLGIDYAE